MKYTAKFKFLVLLNNELFNLGKTLKTEKSNDLIFEELEESRIRAMISNTIWEVLCVEVVQDHADVCTKYTRQRTLIKEQSHRSLL